VALDESEREICSDAVSERRKSLRPGAQRQPQRRRSQRELF